MCRAIKDMFIVNTVRGDDSTGLFQINKKMDTWMYKEPVNGAAFVTLPKAEKYLRDVDESVLTVGHNRAATAGIVSQENAHPFSHTIGERTVVGVHNGTLTDWNKIADAKSFKVDSDWAMYKLAKEGPVDAFEYLRGAFCFVWYDDTAATTLNIARNLQRPMFFAYVKNKDQMIFSSEIGMLGWIANRNNIDIENTIYEVEAGKHYKFDMDNPRLFTKTDLVKDVWQHFMPPSSGKHSGKRKKDKWGTTYDESEWDSALSGWSQDSQSRFFTKMESILGEDALGDTRGNLLSTPEEVLGGTLSEVLTLADLEDANEFAAQGSSVDLGKNINGIYEAEIMEAQELQLDKMMITTEFYEYNKESKTAYFNFLHTCNLADDCSFFDTIGFVEVRNVPASSVKALEMANILVLQIKGVYYDKRLPRDMDACLIADSKNIEDCRKAAAAAESARKASAG